MPTAQPFSSLLPLRPAPRGISIRAGVPDDEFPCFEVMRRSMGYEMSWHHHAATRAHIRNSCGDGFWVAEESARFGQTRVIGYARSLVRDRVWMLTEFFVLSSHHGRGIGGALLARCLETGRRLGADTTLVLASQHSSADSLYVRTAQCFPLLPMFLLAGPGEALRLPDSALMVVDRLSPCLSQGGSRERLFAEPLVLTQNVQREIDILDCDTVGYTRPPEHALWQRDMGGIERASRLFRNESGELLGYGYLGQSTSGPVLARDPALLPSMVTHLARTIALERRPDSVLGASSSPDIYWPMAGTNTTILSWLLECGWQIVFQYLFMCSRPMGRLDRYLCYNPLYFL